MLARHVSGLVLVEAQIGGKRFRLNAWLVPATTAPKRSMPASAMSFSPDSSTTRRVKLLTVVQVQPVVVVTVVDALPPAAGTDWLEGEIANEQGAAAWVTVNVWSAIVSVPVRGLVAVLAAALKLAEPPPEPVAPLVSVSHPASLLTPVHGQPACVVTVVRPEPPTAATD